MTQTWKDIIPANARVTVEYSGKNPKVKFIYPSEMSYRKAVWTQSYSVILKFLFYVLFIPFMIISIPLLIWANRNDHETLISVFILCIYFGIIIILPFLVTFILSRNKEFFSSILPKIGMWNSKISDYTRENNFTPADIRKDKTCYVPLLKNTFMDYEATGDMSAQLKKIEILEYPFEMQRYYLFKKMSKKTNVYYWYCRFSFSELPKDGTLNVVYA